MTLNANFHNMEKYQFK